MTFRNYIVTAFDGVTLHNGTTRNTVGSVQETVRARTQIVELPSGTKYDNMLPTDVAPLVPGTVTAEFQIKEATRATNQTTLGSIAGKLGRRGVLTAREINSATTYTATARMTAVRNVTPSTVLSYLRISVTFELLTDFA